MTKFRAALFDLDGTIADSASLNWESFAEILKKEGVQLRKETYLSLYEGTGARHVFEDVLSKNGKLSSVDVEKLRVERRALFRKFAQLQLVPVKGFGRFFDQMLELNVPRAIVTNADLESAKLCVDILKLNDELLITSQDVQGKTKPDPALYLLAAKKLNIPPKECVVFEDSVPGVIAAKRAGCYCVCVLTTTPEAALKEAGADLIVKDFTQLSPGLFFT